MEISVQIMVNVAIDTKHGPYRDNFYFTQEEWDGSPDLEGLINARASRWVDLMDNPPPPYEPTKGELQAVRIQKMSDIAVLDAQIAEAK